MVRYDRASGRALPYHGSHEADEVPYQLTGDFPNEDAGMIWWRMQNDEATDFHIYFDALNGPAAEPPKVTGLLDLINGTLWAVWWYENVGTATEPRFRARGKMTAGGQPLHTFRHAGSLHAADWSGDGRLDLMLGAECPSDQPHGAAIHLFDRAYLEGELPKAVLGKLEQR